MGKSAGRADLGVVGIRVFRFGNVGWETAIRLAGEDGEQAAVYQWKQA